MGQEATPKVLEKGQSLLNIDKNTGNAQGMATKQSLISKIEEIRKKANTPIKENP